MPDENRAALRKEALRTIKDEVVALEKSPLYTERMRNKVFPVIGEGSHFAKIMFIGEAPGKNEAATGRPFVGAAGKVLEKLLNSVELSRTEVYITNLVKDRPPGNRDPFPEEIAAYAPFLDQQINIIQPEIIATLGRHSMRYVMEHFCPEPLFASITQLHGKVFPGKAAFGEFKIIPLFHPAVAVYDPGKFGELQQDFITLKKLIT